MLKIPYVELPNIAPDYFMVQKNFEDKKAYSIGFDLNSLFIVKASGVKTHRDAFIIDMNEIVLQQRLNVFFDTQYENSFVLSNYDLKVTETWLNTKRKSAFDKQKMNKIAYRPFDNRSIYYDSQLIDRSREKEMRHILFNNIGIIFSRQATDETWTAIQVSDNMIDNRFHFSYKGIPVQAPLYIYPETTDQQTTNPSTERTPNLNLEIIKEVEKALGLDFVPEKETGNLCFTHNNDELRDDFKTTFAPIDLLDYIYAVLHSPTYRDKYKEFLKIDFPRVPYPKDTTTFWQLVQLGGEIRQIHLLESATVENYITQYPVDGDNVVSRRITKNSPGFVPTENGLGKVYINDEQYFDNVPEVAWEFYIGGYQPAQKWLKDRTDRTLQFDDILHYQKIIVALFETDRLMKEIDEVEIE